MKLSRLLVLPAAAAVLFVAGGSALLAQSLSSDPAGNLNGVKIQELHPAPTTNVRVLQPKPTPTPFPLDARTPTFPSLTFIDTEQMSPEDRTLAESSQAEIARRAGLQGFRLDGPGWGYEQAVCPAMPSQLLLEYSRQNGPGDISLFSVAVPRSTAAGGHVRLIPARRRGYSLFTPVSSNALTITDFNHMVREEPQGLSPDWLTLSLCYTALSAGHVRAALVADSSAKERYPLLTPARLEVSGKGGARVQIADATLGVKPLDWVLDFSQDGKLVKARTVPSMEVRKVPVKGTAVDVNTQMAAGVQKHPAQAN